MTTQRSIPVQGVLLLTLALSACGGGTAAPPPPAANAGSAGSSTGTAGSSPAVGPPTVTLKEQIQALEREGKLPALDRSDSVPGPDADGNGVRDDIDAWINQLPITDKQKKAARQDARTTQRMLLVNLDDKAALADLSVQSAANSGCMAASFALHPTGYDAGVQYGFDLRAKLEAMTANTRERAKRYMQYNSAVSGTSTAMPTGNTCVD